MYHAGSKEAHCYRRRTPQNRSHTEAPRTTAIQKVVATKPQPVFTPAEIGDIAVNVISTPQTPVENHPESISPDISKDTFHAPPRLPFLSISVFERILHGKKTKGFDGTSSLSLSRRQERPKLRGSGKRPPTRSR